MRARAVVAAVGLALAQVAGLPAEARALGPVVATFAFSGGEQSFDVPFGVTTIHVVAVGGRGYDVLGGTEPARVEGDLAVTPGTRIYVEVGGNGAAGGAEPGAGAGGFNGGGDGGYGTEFQSYAGGGGGASDIRTLPRTDPASLASRLLVAGGGGGAGNSAVGGDAGQPGDGFDGGGGGAGTDSAGGAGGAGPVPGADGSLGQGGNGASMCDGDVCAPGGFGGGGGGGGYYGGGGGGGGDFAGSGGGGGSSYTGAATNASVSLAASGSDPSVTITYEGGEPGSPTGTVDAVVTMASSAVCLVLTTTAIDFGTRQFGGVGQPATPSIGIANCSSESETILARGTDAVGAGPSTWSLVATGSCVDETLGLDEFRLRLENQDTEDQVSLTTTNTTLHTLASFASASHVALIDTPCPGSSGAGVVMGMQIVFVATE